MADRGIELVAAGELLARLVTELPDSVRAAHEATVRYSRKPGDDVLATLDVIVGRDAANTVRAVLGRPPRGPQ